MSTIVNRRGLLVLLVLMAGRPVPAAGQQPAPPPTFHAATDRIAIDVAVVDDKGDAVTDLGPGDFVLTIDGKPRQLVSAELVRTDSAPAATAGAAGGPAGTGFSSNESTAGGRLVLLAFDLDGIPAGGGRNAARAAGGFLDALSPQDQVSLLSLPNGVSVPFTPDRARVRDALGQIVGRGMNELPHDHAIGLSEAFEIESGNTFALDRVTDRECSPSRAADLPEADRSTCITRITEEARTIATANRIRSTTALQSFQALLVSLQRIDAPKIVIWISGGVPLPFAELALSTLSADAAAARATVYVVHLDSAASGVDASRAQRSPTLVEDRAIGRHGLETMAGVTRGAVFSSIGTGSDAFDRIAREMSAYYLLGAEATLSDRDGKAHRIKVSLPGRQVTVRTRREFIVPTDADVARSRGGSPEEQVARVLQSPIPASELPLSVATYNLQAPDGKVRVVVVSDIGRQESGALDTSLGYTVRSASGRVVASAFHSARAEPTPDATPGPAHATVAIDLPPGPYTLKLAVVDSGGRRGSVEHAFDASIKGTGGIGVADLVLAPPISASAPSLQLTAAPGARAAPLDAYLELYGASGKALPQVSVEVADRDAGPAIARAQATVSQRGEKGRYVAEATLPLGLLPPGPYVARAIVTVGSTTVERSRQFRIVEPVPPGDLFKAELASRVGTFDRNDVLTPALVGPALESAVSLDGGKAGGAARALAREVAGGQMLGLSRLALGHDDSLLASFLRGLSLYQAGRIEDAATEFRAAIRGSSDFLPGVFYLGACYAAGGKAREAVAAWQTALIGDSPQPEVYRLIADAYLRLDDPDEASSLLEEAAERWPDDAAIRLQGAVARAANGHVNEALAALQPGLGGETIDPQIGTLALELAVARVATHEDPATEAELRDLVGRLSARGVGIPVAAERWLAYLDAQRAR